MIKITYKPGKRILSTKNKNNYSQLYFTGKLLYKGYVNKNNYIGYQENYLQLMGNKGIKYIL
jgi:hypothetical protein